MSEIWFVSDHHFNHNNILTFTSKGTNDLIRSGFADIHEMNEYLVEQHNKYVGEFDKVYFGGDVGNRIHEFLPRMKGKKRLILGNHDNHKPDVYLKHFQKILSWREFGDRSSYFMFCHYPLHRCSFDYRGRRNDVNFCVHGHLHEKLVRDDFDEIDLRYINVSVEQTQYRPLSMTELLEEMECRKKILKEQNKDTPNFYAI